MVRRLGIARFAFNRRHSVWWLAALAAFAAVSCDRAATPALKAPPEVTVMAVAPRATPVWLDLVADIRADQEVTLRARVSGVVEARPFQPGQRVKAGQVLFVIDPRQYLAAVADARANLAQAQAELTRARQDVERYRPLLADNAIPKQTYDNAVATEEERRALVDARRALVEQAELNLQYTRVRSPLNGIVGLQKIEVGGLVTAGQTDLATVSTIHPIYAYFNITEAEYLELARRLKAAGAKEQAQTRQRPIELYLADGSKYPHSGTFDFADRAVSPTTGTLTMRAKFPNPEELLRPGMYGQVRINYDVRQDALLVPQKSVTELLGKRFVSVVGADNKVEQREVEMGERVGTMWIVERGLQSGERVIVDGLQKALAGAVVKPALITETQAAALETAPSAAPDSKAP